MKIGAMIAHLGITPGMMMSIRNTSRMKPISSASAPMFAFPSWSASFVTTTAEMLE